MSRRPSERALRCARDAQAARHPFIYEYHRVELPDVDMNDTLVAGANGERVLLESGDAGSECRRDGPPLLGVSAARRDAGRDDVDRAAAALP